MPRTNDQTRARRRVTIRDVAAAAGVDPSLVSRVVNDDPKASASAATRARILEVVEQLGYRANAAARSLASSSTSTIGLLLPDLANPMYGSILTGVARESEERGYGVIVASRAEGESEESFSRLLQTGPVDGLLIASGLFGDDFLRRITRFGGGPVVLVNRRVRGVGASVTVDDAAGAELAVRHLVEHGHRDIVGLFGPDDVDTSLRRRRGYEKAIAAAGLASRTVGLESWNMQAGHRAALELFDSADRPTAVFASTIAMGIGVLRAARERDIAVPDDVSVIAFHDIELADYLAPPLSVVKMPTEEMGARAVRLLISLIEGGEPGNQVVRGPMSVIARASVARPRGNPRGR
jgi:LacI family transcriptional regulator